MKNSIKENLIIVSAVLGAAAAIVSAIIAVIMMP